MQTLVTPKNLTELLGYEVEADQKTLKHKSKEGDVVIWFEGDKPVADLNNKKNLDEIHREIESLMNLKNK